MDVPRNAAPSTRAVLRAQIDSMRPSLRLPAVAVAGLILLGTFMLISAGDAEAGLNFAPEEQMLPGIAGLLLPLLVWKGRERLGTGFFWTLPVDRQRHALVRVFAGWIWLMAGVAFFVLWQVGVTALSSGSFLAERTVHLLPDFSPAIGHTIDMSEVQTMSIRPNPWFWLVPFTAASATYLLASALALGVRTPAKWFAAIVVVFFLVGFALQESGVDALRLAPSRALRAAFEGAYGWDQLLTARTESLKTRAVLENGEHLIVWRGLPDAKPWAIGTLLWIAAGLITVWAATYRHREDRRG
jgi:hypothetical protein